MVARCAIQGMSCMNAVDTNVLVYSLDGADPAKQTKAKALLGSLVGTQPATIVPWQVVAELLSWLRKWESAGHVSGSDVEAHFRDLMHLFPVALPTSQVFSRYMDMFARFSLSHWDAMLLAACKEAGVTTLYSEDMDNGTSYDGLVIVNPFV